MELRIDRACDASPRAADDQRGDNLCLLADPAGGEAPAESVNFQLPRPMAPSLADSLARISLSSRSAVRSARSRRSLCTKLVRHSRQRLNLPPAPLGLYPQLSHSLAIDF